MFSQRPSNAVAPPGLARAITPAPPEPSYQDGEREVCISELLPHFFSHITHEVGLTDKSVKSYREHMKKIVKTLGDMPPERISEQHILILKSRCAERGNSANYVSCLIYALRSFLKFCQLEVGLETLDPKTIKAPRIPKRDVVFLTPKEVQQYVSGIPVREGRKISRRWLCFRVLVEVLLGTGMRISEALSLKRSSINYETGEAIIIGKGNKERTVFFSPRALGWVKEYVTWRKDARNELFINSDGKPLVIETAMGNFRLYWKMSGMKKRVTAHILRHTVATTLLFNGCPIGHIKEILGHTDLMTTCRYYLGTDKRAAKGAHQEYLLYNRRKPAVEAVSDPFSAGPGGSGRALL